MNGETYNLCFWYIPGNLSGDELLDQFYKIVMRCETVNCRVFGMTSDAGDNNAKLFKFLPGDIPLPEGGWLDLNDIRVFHSFKKH